MSKDYIVTVWLPFVVRVENMTDGAMAQSVAEDYLIMLDPLSGDDTLAKLTDEAAEATVWFPADGDVEPIWSVDEADDSEDYEDEEAPA